jgi:hypothetical protein
VQCVGRLYGLAAARVAAACMRLGLLRLGALPLSDEAMERNEVLCEEHAAAFQADDDEEEGEEAEAA